MDLWRSTPQKPVPLAKLLLSIAVLWLAPMLVGVIGLAMFFIIGKTWADLGLGVWFYANALFYSPLFSWVGWLIALPAIWLALRQGLFGWAYAAMIGAAAGSLASGLVDSELALPFGIVALLILRAVLGRVLPL